MKTLFKWFIVVLAFASLNEVNAKTIGLRVSNASGVEGTYINVPINADTSFTGENVIAFDISLTYNTSIFNVDTIVTMGTLMSSWNNIALDRSVAGKIRIVAVNATPLSGTGVLFYLRLYCKSYGGSYINFDAANITLNEGNPKTKLTNGYINITAKPKISVSPNSGLITAGDKLQFYAGGGTSPYTWSVTNPSVASISSTGLLTSTAKGFTRVVAIDNSGIRDTSDFNIEIRGLKLYFRDTSIFEAHTLLLPIYTTNLGGLNIKSGSLKVTFNSSYLKAKNIINTGSILSTVSNIQFNSVEGSGECTFSFAATSNLTGSGILCYIEFEAIAGGYNSLNIGDVLFNEDILSNSQAATVQVKTLPVLNISPSITSLKVGSAQKFVASNGTAPYTWTTSDPSLGSIASDGTFTALKSGRVQVIAQDFYGAKGTSSFIDLTAANISIHDSLVNKNMILSIPVYLENYITGNDLFSYQFDINYDTSRVVISGINKSGSLSSNWTIIGNQVGNQYKIEGANIQSIHSSGVLFYLQVQLKNNMSQWQTTTLQFQNIIFNEGLPLITYHNGNLQNQTPVKNQMVNVTDGYRIFPNPNHGEFIINIEQNRNLYAEVLNSEGKVIKSISSLNLGTNFISLHIPAGTYIVLIKDQGTIKSIHKMLIY